MALQRETPGLQGRGLLGAVHDVPTHGRHCGARQGGPKHGEKRRLNQGKWRFWAQFIPKTVDLRGFKSEN